MRNAGNYEASKINCVVSDCRLPLVSTERSCDVHSNEEWFPMYPI